MNNEKELSVIKLGGSLLENEAQRQQALKAIAASREEGKKLVVVHGGGRNVDGWLSKLGIPKKTHQGLRLTDKETLEVVVSVLAGFVNKSLVGELAALGAISAGFSGADGRTLVADFHPELGGIGFGFVGQIRAVSPTLIRRTLACGMLPVIAPLGMGPDGTLLNINADRAASALAVALKARRLLFLTDVEGLLDGAGRVVRRLAAPQVKEFLQTDIVNGGMRPKLAACLEALEGGVAEVIIAGPNRHMTAFREGRGGTILVAA